MKQIKQSYLIGPNNTSDGCVNHYSGTQMLCSGCPAKISKGIQTNEKICEILSSGNKSTIRSLRRRIIGRTEKLIERGDIHI